MNAGGRQEDLAACVRFVSTDETNAALGRPDAGYETRRS
jgi:hypothetical protein